jgi:hypothetical protein
MCSEMSQYMPSNAIWRAMPDTPEGSAAHAGRPETRSEKATARVKKRGARPAR